MIQICKAAILESSGHNGVSRLPVTLQNKKDISKADKHNLLIYHVNAAVYETISVVASYNDAITQLERVYATNPNSIFSWYLLRSCRQQPGQSVDEFFQKLKQLCANCDFRAVTAQVHK